MIDKFISVLIVYKNSENIHHNISHFEISGGILFLHFISDR